ncbi:MAG: SGNH/GDSL hydrolase family protein [Planctomycetes bacterium]|nr:SGNH/GDSL hydrolase family protein [Planctomycetota bacterium]
MYKTILLLVPLLGLAVAVLDRVWRTPGLVWNWLALLLVASGLTAVGMGWRSRKQERKPKWYSLRPGIIAAGTILLLAAWYVARVPAPMGDGPAGPAVDATAFARPWSERPVVLLSLGDSVSTGYGAPGGHGYFELIRENSNETYPEMSGLALSHTLPNIRVVRKASNSTNSADHLASIRTLPAYSAETFGIVCITTGGIDLIHYYGKAEPREGAMYGATWEQAEPWIKNFRSRLGEMMKTLQERFPGGCAVMLATIYEPTDGVGDVENAGPMFWLPPWPDGKRVHGAYNDALRDCAAEHDFVHLVDVHGVMIGHGIHCQDRTNEFFHEDDPTYWYFVNLEDPNRRGYDAIRRVFLNEITTALRHEPGFDVPPVSGP